MTIVQDKTPSAVDDAANVKADVAASQAGTKAHGGAKANSPKHTGGFFGNLLFNIVLPTVILSYLSEPEYLGAHLSVVVALSFPILYGIFDLHKVGKINAFSVLGIVSVLLTGGISLFELDPKYIAIKEASIPALIGIGVLFTHGTRFSIVRMLLLNEDLMDVKAINQSAEANGNATLLDKRIRIANHIIASSFFISAILNYLLAIWIVVSPPGTTEYSQQLGKMTALSYPVIMVPSMLILIGAIFYLFKQIHKLTGKELDDFMLH